MINILKQVWAHFFLQLNGFAFFLYEFTVNVKTVLFQTIQFNISIQFLFTHS